jgi:Putative zinc-finger
MNHVSELSVDKYLAGELSRESAAMLREHAATCARCNDSLDHALQTRDAFEFVSPRAKPRRWLYAAPVALAAAFALVIAWPKPHDLVRTKGTAIVGFFIAHGDAVRRGALNETVTPGDRLELVTSTTESGFFAAISIDQLGTRSVYVPLVAIAPGREQVVPGAVELDAQLGRETVTGVFCADHFNPMTIALDALPAGCTADHFTLDKK